MAAVAIAAYTDALMWTITRDQRYADMAIEIMDAWATTLQELVPGQARPLFDHAAGYLFADRDSGEPDFNGNWELIMMDAAASISVFLNDRASFDQPVAIWRARVPAYIYLTADGPLPIRRPAAPRRRRSRSSRIGAVGRPLSTGSLRRRAATSGTPAGGSTRPRDWPRRGAFRA